MFAVEAKVEQQEDRSPIVSTLAEAIVAPNSRQTIPTYRIMDEDGKIVNPKELPNLSDATLLKVYESMIRLSVSDDILNDVQRQGKISFMMQAKGEEATHFGSATALEMRDVIYGQYREAGVLMWRGFSIDDICNQCFSNSLDLGKGRQMPVHYGSRKLNFQTISSPLATQIPQTTGAALALKLANADAVCIGYFGEGAASEGDFHAGLNFASTLEVPAIFFCRNNKYAISTPSTEQYRGDGIAARGLAYGIYTLRVDGNDFFAVHNATKAAREYALKHNRPVLIEAMTYRVSHHSTSDDATRYRPNSEVEKWAGSNPIKRMKVYLQGKKLWSEEKEKALQGEVRREVLAAIKRAEAELKPPIADLFNDVYDTDTPVITEQRAQLAEHLKTYGDKYPLNKYKP